MRPVCTASFVFRSFRGISGDSESAGRRHPCYNGEAERAGKGFIILEIGIHGIPVNLTGDVYHRLYNGALKNYHSFNMDNRDKYYYKRVYTAV